MTAAAKKTAVVTGASSGIGFALTKMFLEHGFDVVGNARTRERLTTAHRELGSPSSFLAVEGDIGDPATSERIAREASERFGQIDVWVNNAGIFQVKPFVDVTPEDIDALVRANLFGFVHGSQAAAKHMIPRRQGAIISITASIAQQPSSKVPATVPILIKAGINQATKALALELAPHGITVAAVAPGIIDTPLYEREQHDFLAGLQPAGRIGTPNEIADAVWYLANAKFTTGTVLTVDGGMAAGR